MLGIEDDINTPKDAPKKSKTKKSSKKKTKEPAGVDFEECSQCEGDGGAFENNAWVVCSHCEGDGGWVKQKRVICDECNGEGFKPIEGTKNLQDCPKCDGVGGWDPTQTTTTPEQQDYPHPFVIRKTRRHKGRLYLAGEHLNNPTTDAYGERVWRTTSSIMFIEPAILEEECGAGRHAQQYTSKTLQRMSIGMLKGAVGSMFKNLLRQSQVQEDWCYYTAMIKWNLGSAKMRKSPKAADIKKAMPTLRQEIREVQPKIIVCLGKSVFDQLWTGVRFKQKDVQGAYFWEPSLNCHLYLMGQVTEPLLHPQYIEKWLIDLREVRNLLGDILGCVRKSIPLDYRVAYTLADVRAWVDEMLVGGYEKFCTDIESAGRTFVTKKLRSLQVCWKPGSAIFIRFMDENMEYSMDASYEEVGKELSRLFGKPEVGFIGHQLTVDVLWMYAVLGIEVYKKCKFDTLFAQQVLDEYSELKLERLSIQYTTLGRYDLELKTWVKENGLDEDEGYGRIPDKILIPYALRDVDVPFRMHETQMVKLKKQDLEDYYYNLHLPFVTDVFTCFSYVGLPVDRDRLYYMRDLYIRARDLLNTSLQRKIFAEAQQVLFMKLHAVTQNLAEAAAHYQEFETRAGSSQPEAKNYLVQDALPDKAAELEPFIDHYFAAPNFNIRSTKDMIRWLFIVKGHEPLKTTGSRSEGIPSISWERVKQWPPEKQKTVTPAVDTSTIKVLAEKDDILKDVRKLNLIGNQVKNFLKPPKADGREDGVFQWVCADGRIHGNFSSTETGRPRSWQPNLLNWSKEVAVEIEAALRVAFEDQYQDAEQVESQIKELMPEKEFSEIKDTLNEGGVEEAISQVQILVPQAETRQAELIDIWRRYADLHVNVYSLRSCIMAPPGYCFVESDLQTAEIVTLAYISGDRDLLAAVTEYDTQFAIDAETGKPRRISWAPYCRISDEKKTQDLLYPADDSRWKRDSDGNLVHPKRDLHWETIEDRLVMDTPREQLEPLHGGRGKAIYRGAGKVGNFQLQYGASGSGIEQSIEAATLSKPEKGLGDKIKESFATRFHVAADYQDGMAELALKGGNYRSFSGRIRRSFALDKREAYDLGLSEDDAARSASGLSREYRNFPQQEGVGAHMARGGIWLLEHYIAQGMETRPVICLYDAMLSLAPLHERFEGLALHKKYLSEVNKWPIEDRTLEFGTDDELAYRWSTEPTPKQKAELYDRNWNT